MKFLLLIIGIILLIIGSKMTYSYSKTSKEKYDELDPRLKKLLDRVLTRVDFSILEGHRGADEQNKLFDEGKSKLQFPFSKHNQLPSRAVDIAPYPIDWENIEAFENLALIVFEEAEILGLKIRWGGDWNMTWNTKNPRPAQSFDDLPHFEIADYQGAKS